MGDPLEDESPWCFFPWKMAWIPWLKKPPSSRIAVVLPYYQYFSCSPNVALSFSRELSIFTGSCFACGISLPLCFIIAQVPKQKKNTWNPVLPNWCCWPFFPTVRRALFLVHACPVLASWLGKDRIMDSLKRFVFSNIQILKFKKGWEKIGLWIPLFDFFQIRNLMFKKKN